MNSQTVGEYIPKFSVGDIVCSSISSPRRIEEIRIGRREDFVHDLWVGDLCYVMQYLGGKQLRTVWSVQAVDADYHLKGSEMYEEYETERRAYYASIGKE